MKILIGIVSKNRAAILPKAIESALEQSIGDKIISVFDDNSTDNTKDLKSLFPQVDWFFSDSDKNYVYARNKLMKNSPAQYYCSLDDDSWFIQNDSLIIACNYLDNHPEVAAIAFDILSPDKPAVEKVSAPFETNLFIGCGHVLRLSAVREIGYYLQFPGYYAGEERDLCLRLIDKGYKIVKLPGVHVWHDKTNVSRNIKKQFVSNVCNDLSYAYIRFPLFYMLLSIPYKLLIHGKFGIKNKLPFSALKGFAKFFLFLFTFRLKRSPVSLNAYKRFQQLY